MNVQIRGGRRSEVRGHALLTFRRREGPGLGEESVGAFQRCKMWIFIRHPFVLVFAIHVGPAQASG